MDLKFEKDDRVFFKVTHFKGISRFDKSEKLSSYFIGPFEILDRIGTAAYRLPLAPELFRIDNVFHVSMLCKYNLDLSHVLAYEPLPLQEDMSYEGVPVGIVDRKSRLLCNQKILFVKVI